MFANREMDEVRRLSAADAVVWEGGVSTVSVHVAGKGCCGLTHCAEGLGDHAVPDEVLEVPFWNRVSKVFNG